MQTKIGQRLSLLMKKKGVTQTQISNNNIMRPSTLKKILSGETSNNKKIIEILEYLEATKEEKNEIYNNLF